MPDLRTLLHDAAQHPPAPDPVGAVHRRVHRRAVRRGATVTAGAALATAGTFAVVAGGGAAAPDRPHPAASGGTARPSGLSTAYDRSWRATMPHPVVIPMDGTHERLRAIAERPASGIIATTSRSEGGFHYAVILEPDADVNGIAEDLNRAVAPYRWTWVRCPHTSGELDRVATEVLSAPWPSGAAVRRDLLDGWQVSFEYPCTVVVEMDSVSVSPLDGAFARARWPEIVRLVPADPSNESRG